MTVWHWILHFFGISNESGEPYAWWSGAGSDLGELAILGVVIQGYRHHKCATCHRIGRHPVEGMLAKTCHKHSTVAVHSELHARHEREHPEQHELLNRPKPPPNYLG